MAVHRQRLVVLHESQLHIRSRFRTPEGRLGHYHALKGRAVSACESTGDSRYHNKAVPLGTLGGMECGIPIRARGRRSGCEAIGTWRVANSAQQRALEPSAGSAVFRRTTLSLTRDRLVLSGGPIIAADVVGLRCRQSERRATARAPLKCTAAAGTDRVYSPGGVRGTLSPHPGGSTHRRCTHITSSPENPGRFNVYHSIGLV